MGLHAAALFAQDVKLRFNGAFLSKSIHIAADSGRQSEIIKHHRAQVKYKVAHFLERGASSGLQVAEFLGGAVRIAIKETLANLCLENEVRE